MAIKISCVAVILLVSASSAHAQAAADMADDLSKLRAEVEQLSADLITQKTELRNELQALARQKSDLQIELDREHVRASKLRAGLTKKKHQVEATSKQGEELRPLYEAGLVAMRGYVQASMPFRQRERIAELAKIEEQQRSGVLSFPRALARLWGFIEDEFRMTRENAMFQQTVVIDGQEQLADVVRVGMVMLFYMTSDGTTGHTQRAAAGWSFVGADGAARKQIRTLFDSFKKQIRVGLFLVPNALPTIEP